MKTRWWWTPILSLLVCAVLFGAADADAAKKRTTRKRARKAPTPSGPVEIPIEVRAGPIALIPSPPAFGDQPVFAGLQIHVAAVVDQDLIRRYRSQVPAWARGAARNVDEVQVRPWYLALIPDVLIISPQVKDTGMYGAIWRPFGVGLPLFKSEAFKLKADAGVGLTVLYLHSQTLGGGTVTSPSHTFTVRPGLNLGLTGLVPLSKSWLVSFGWSSEFFVPQVIGGGFFDALPLGESLWHLGGPFFSIHHRFPLAL